MGPVSPLAGTGPLSRHRPDWALAGDYSCEIIQFILFSCAFTLQVGQGKPVPWPMGCGGTL